MTDKHLDLYSAFGDVVRDHVKSVTSRSHGASGIELTSVASSTYAAYFGIAAEHDIAAARVILQEAGAKISTFPAPEGSRSGYFYMVASHGQIHEQLVKAFKKVIYPNPEISGDLTADAKQIQQQL